MGNFSERDHRGASAGSTRTTAFPAISSRAYLRKSSRPASRPSTCADERVKVASLDKVAEHPKLVLSPHLVTVDLYAKEKLPTEGYRVGESTDVHVVVLGGVQPEGPEFVT